MCVYGMLHVAWYFSCTYLVGTLMLRFTATTTTYLTHREREGGREMREFDSVMMTVSPFHFSLFLSLSPSLIYTT